MSRAATVTAALIFLVTWGLTTHGKYSVTGDEPHYLMVTQSLLAEATSTSPTTISVMTALASVRTVCSLDRTSASPRAAVRFRCEISACQSF